MEVDLKKLSAGDTVTFKCGGTAKIAKIEKSLKFNRMFFVVFVDTDGAFGSHYTRDGRITAVNDGKGLETMPFNIVEAIK